MRTYLKLVVMAAASCGASFAWIGCSSTSCDDTNSCGLGDGDASADGSDGAAQRDGVATGDGSQQVDGGGDGSANGDAIVDAPFDNWVPQPQAEKIIAATQHQQMSDDE